MIGPNISLLNWTETECLQVLPIDIGIQKSKMILRYWGIKKYDIALKLLKNVPYFPLWGRGVKNVWIFLVLILFALFHLVEVVRTKKTLNKQWYHCRGCHPKNIGNEKGTRFFSFKPCSWLEGVLPWEMKCFYVTQFWMFSDTFDKYEYQKQKIMFLECA